MADYWKTRELKDRLALFDLTETQLLRLLRKQYREISDYVAKRLSDLYARLRASGEPITADMLYREKRYLELLNELSQKISALGEYEKMQLTSGFIDFYKKSYLAAGIPVSEGRVHIDDAVAVRAINSFRPGDGKNFSDRIWANKRKLLEVLQRNISNTVISGANWSGAVKEIQKTFGSSFAEARRLVRTELSNVERNACLDKYRSEGVKYVRWLASADCRTCEQCLELDDKIFEIDKVPSLQHPNDRCTVLAVIDLPKKIPISLK